MFYRFLPTLQKAKRKEGHVGNRKVGCNGIVLLEAFAGRPRPIQGGRIGGPGIVLGDGLF